MTDVKKQSIELFIARAPMRSVLGGNLTDTQFRRGLMDNYMEKFDATNAKAATLYNNAKKFCEANHANLVVDLGRKKSAATPVLKSNPRSTSSIKSEDGKRADSRQLYSAVTLCKNDDDKLMVDTVHAFYNVDDAIAEATNKDMMVVKGLPECDTLASKLKDIREKF